MAHDNHDTELVKWIRHSSPYVRSHRGKTLVIGLPGEVLANEHFYQIIHDIALLHTLGLKIVLCHGARPQIDHALQEHALQIQYVNGIRVTSADMLRHVKSAVSLVQLDIQAQLSMGTANTTMAGASIVVVCGNFVVAQPYGVRNGIDHEFTGRVRKIHTHAISQALEANAIVLASPLGFSPTGEIFNLTYESVAASIAQELRAEKLLYCIPPQVWSKQLNAEREWTLAEAERHILAMAQDPMAHYIQKAIDACKAGVKRTHFINMDQDGAILLELFTRDGSGCMICADVYEDIYDANIDDIGGILELITPLEEQGILVRRSREKLETEIKYFSVMKRDGLVIGCAAMYPYIADQMAELACFAIHADYAQMGRGQAMLEFLEKRAKKLGIHKLFVLTTQTQHWFIERGFAPMEISALPIKHQSLYNYKRNSKVLAKLIS